MKKTVLTTALLLISSPVLAVQFGTIVNWSEPQFDNIAKNNCTNTVIGSGFILTAEHCKNGSSVEFNNGSHIDVYDYSTPFPLAQGETRYVDIALAKLADKASTTSFTPLSVKSLNDGDEVKLYGFGRYEDSAEAKPLTYAVRAIAYQTKSTIRLANIGQGRIISGDSGGANIVNGAIVAVNSSSFLTEGDTDASTHTKLSNSDVNKWIIETVNGWHYPTVVKTNSNTVVKVQSLNLGQVGDIANVISTAGDVQIDYNGITCESMMTLTDALGNAIEATPSDIQAYDVCSIPVESTGFEGTITLGNDVINVNPNVKPEIVEPEITPPTEEGSGGGSLGLLSLLGLAFVAFKRNRK